MQVNINVMKSGRGKGKTKAKGEGKGKRRNNPFKKSVDKTFERKVLEGEKKKMNAKNNPFKKSVDGKKVSRKGTGILLAAIMVASVFAAAMPAMVNAAPVGTEATFENQTRYDPSASAHVATGGNITNVTISATTLTKKWQGYYGNVTQDITLRDGGGKVMFDWDPTAFSGSGEVIATTNSSVDWTKSLDNVTKADIDVNWCFDTGDADSATNTFTDGMGTVTINGKDLVTTRAYTYNLTGADTWVTVAAIGLNASGYEDDFLFVGIIADKTAYKGGDADFQMIVPTTEGGYETYYFYIEL